MIIVLTGPTGSGKTKLAIELAKRINAEIINADAFQVYKDLSIATAKPTKEEREIVPHHLFDFVPLDEEYSVALYQKQAREIIDSILQKGKDVIIAGGTGFYIKAALYDYKFNEEETVDMSKYEALNNEELHKELEKVDPTSASEIHPNNRKRVLRAIKIYLSTGRPKSAISIWDKPRLMYVARFFELKCERADIYRRADERVDEMFKNGLVEETVPLIEQYGRDSRAFAAIGVKELFPYIDKEKTLDQVKDDIKLATRHYIKRQETYFNNQFPIIKIKNLKALMKHI